MNTNKPNIAALVACATPFVAIDHPSERVSEPTLETGEKKANIFPFQFHERSHS